jgi:hypothetical protein
VQVGEAGERQSPAVLLPIGWPGWSMPVSGIGLGAAKVVLS